jgi:DNA-binding response OmpR family regulator
METRAMPGANALLLTAECLEGAMVVVRGLARHGLAVSWARDAREVLQLIPRRQPEVLLLDLAALDLAAEPGDDGLHFCRPLRFLMEGPIMVVGTPADKARILRALSLGVDAFLLQPTDPELLAAALAALRRRAQLAAPVPDVVEVRELAVDLRAGQVRLHAAPVALTATEYRILSYLASHLGRVVSARLLLQEAQGYACEEREAQRIVKVHVRHLRQKLPAPPGERPYIVNVRGLGYVLERRGTDRPGDVLAELTG